MQTNKNMLNAQANPKDEFYTKIETIAKEMPYYEKYLKEKTVYCNCDNPEKSNFWKYFVEHFKAFGLSSLVSTYWDKNEKSHVTRIVKKGDRLVKTTKQLLGNGDYRSAECIEILKNADVVITNPPFSLTKDFIPLMYEYKKDFIILSNQNILTFKDVYPKVINNKIRFGISIHSGDVEFEIPESYELKGNSILSEGKKYAKVTGIRWITNIDHGYYPLEMELHTKKWNLRNNKQLIKHFKNKYQAADYPTYDNYPAIEVPYTSAIPCDYNGVFGVPITFLDKYNPNQFQIVGFRKGNDGKDLRVGKVTPYFRFLVQLKAR